MKDFWSVIIILIVFGSAIFVGYALYDGQKKRENVGKSVVIGGDTLKIVELTQLVDMYVLENGIVVKYREK